MAELELKGASISFGAGALLDEADLVIEAGERVGLLGRNGAGKTTLMRVLSGALELDEGELKLRPGLVITRLEQDVPSDAVGTIEALIRSSLADTDIEEWEIEKRVERECDRFELDPSEEVSELSAGMKRRALLASALAHDPDLLILDEPTNHLELEAIQTLEDVLLKRRAALLFVTHDRAFLRKLSTRILDLDRGKLKSYDCDYGTYLKRKASDLADEEKRNAEFDKHLAKEEVWIRKGILARRTRNMGRVRALTDLRDERTTRRNQVGQARAKVQENERSGHLVLRALGLDFAYGENTLFKGLDFELVRGDRVGIVGPNGAGKSTLLSLLLAELKPDNGSIRHGTKLEVARFDQLHESLDPKRTVGENVTGAGDSLTIDGIERHVISYLADFLFTPDQVRGEITKLSGGERNRLQLARILARPCNLLVLDEPTNDLDLETLEMLEELLSSYKGTLLLVSHDREFLENVVTSILAPDEDAGPGVWREYMGGYMDWQRVLKRRTEELANTQSKQRGGAKQKKTQSHQTSTKARKLTFTESHELKALPDAVESLESQKNALLELTEDADYYKRPQSEQGVDRAKLEELERELEHKMKRWELLEGLSS
jgi:ATP-binding cassette subfamily F protein uup